MGLFGQYTEAVEQGGSVRPAAEPPIRETGFVENVAAGFQASRSGPDMFSNQARYENNARDEIASALEQRGIAVRRIGVAEAMGYQRRLDRGEKLPAQAMDHLAKFNAMLSALSAEQKRDPNFLPTYSGVRDIASLSAKITELRRRDLSAAEQVQQGATGWGTFGGLIGGLGGELTKPETYIPVGGGSTVAAGAARQILSVAAREAAANAAVTALGEPLVQADATRLGIDRTLQDAAVDVAVSAAAGAVLGGAAKSIEFAPDAIASVRESFLASQFDRLPESVQRRMIDGATIDDRALTSVIGERFGTDRLTPDERAAMHVLDYDADVRESSPFKPGPDADMLHGQRLAAAIDALKAGEPAPTFAPAKRPPLQSQTALSSSVGEIASRIAMAESANKPTAKNPNSTASGLGQFIDSTWLSGMKQWFPRVSKGKSDAELLALKTDAKWGRRMLERAVLEYDDVLRRNDLPRVPANYYILHFFGPETGRKLLRWPDETRLSAMLPKEVIDANASVLRGKTAGELRAWAASKVGGEQVPVTVGKDGIFAPDAEGVELRADLIEDPAIRREAERELYGPEPDRAAELVRAVDAIRGTEQPAPDMPAITAEDGPFVEKDIKPRQPRKTPDGPVELLTQIARWGGLRDNEGNDFAVTSGLSNRMTQGGRVLRKGGMTVDQLGEKLWEAGWFGPPSVAERPSMDEVIDLVERGARERVYHPEDVAIVSERTRQIDDGEEEIRSLLDGAARDMGIADMDGSLIEEAIGRIRRGEDADQALMGAINMRSADELAAMAEEAGAGPARVETGMTFDDWERLGEMQDSLARWDDPEGQAALDQALSIEHDLRMAMEADPAGGFRIDDAGDEYSIAALLDEADREEAAITAMEACMTPGGMTE
ncbi:MAG: hypothetical protein IE934_07345 [Sphingopyxis sp.]|nr:hypothetical protein [Sphingopyxis sp.]